MLFAVFGRDVFVVFWVWIRSCFPPSFEVRISITERGRTIGHCKDYPDANDELQAGSMVFQPGEVAVARGQGKEERVRRMMWLGLLDTKSNRSRLGGGNSNIF